jgi:predicted DNA-binding transcriptional regulator YafY
MKLNKYIMSKREFIARYGLIINKLRKGQATFNEIDEYLKYQSEIDEYNYRVSKRTFQRDLVEIQSLFGVEIAFDYRNKVYRINLDEHEEIGERVLEAFDTINALNASERISNFIHFEKRRPQGTENFNGLLHAIRNNHVIKFTYCKYWDNNISQRMVEPYALKEFKSRWYVISKDQKDGIVKSFGLDRITNLDILKKKFHPTNFNVNEHYRNCFGIIGSDEQGPSEVILSFTPFQGRYVKSMPLHESQQVIVDNEEELRIKLTVYITEDFVMEIMSHGDRVIVLQPIQLKDEVRSIHLKAAEH